MSYKGNIMCSVVNLYKRGKKTADIPEGTFDIGYFDYYVGEFEKVVPNLDEYSVLYYGDDVEQKHPIYRLNNPIDKKLKIDLGGEKISTLFINDDKYVNMSDGQTYSDKVIGFGFYPEKTQNFGYNFKNYTDKATGAVPVNDRYNKYKSGNSESNYFDVTCSSLYRIKKNYEEYFFNGDINGLTAYYKPDLDYMIVPGYNPITQMVEYYDQNVNTVYMKSFFRGLHSNVPNSLIGSGFSTSRYMTAYGQFQILNDKERYTTFYPPIFCDPAIPLRYIAGNAYVDSRYFVKTIPFFLKDKKGEYWLMYTIYGAVYGDNNLYPDGGYRDVVLMKIKDIPTTFINAVQTIDTVNTSPLTWITSEEYADPKTIDAFLDVVFSVPDEANYNDGGPDIVGPDKDPYDGVLDNTDEMIGGEPNMEDKIEQDDGTYNDSGSIIRGWGNFYGSYVLNQGALSQYVNTLTWLNGKWGSLLWPVYNLMSDRIKNNTINLIHLPFRVPDANVVQRPFTVGNTAIMQSTTDGGLINDWELGRITGIATVNLLQKEITTDVVNLGVLGHYYDNFLDFAPYSSASLYIPYIGTVELPINLIQSTSEGEQKQLQLLFRINNSTGDMIVLLQVNGSTVKQWSGNCARDIQISVDATGGVLRSMSNTIVGGMLGGIAGGLGGSIAAAAATGGLSGFDYQVQKEMYEQSSPEMRRETTWGQTTGARLSAYEHKQQAAGAAGKAMVNSMQKLPEVNSSPVPNHSIGNMPTAGEIGFMGPQEVRLIVERPIIWRPKDYGDLIGYPTKKIAKLSSVKGFAKVSNIHLRCNATLAEKTEIEQMLNAGVIFSDN